MRFKILDMPWNLNEQYELLRLPSVEWSWLVQYRVGYRLLRPELAGFFKWAPYYEGGRYDAAVLHLDLELIEPLPKALSRRRVYEELNGLVKDIPKIVIVHGSSPEAKCGWQEVRDLIGDNYAVVGSDAIAERLGAGHVIMPGVLADDWPDSPKEPRVVTNLSQATGAGVELVESLRVALEERDIILCRIGVDYLPNTWEEYRDFLGRSLIYFAPPAYSERPKMEAASSGCCVLSPGPPGRAANFDEYVVSTEPEEIAGLVEDLITDPAEARRVGREMRDTARRRYDWGRYAQQWMRSLETVVEGRTALRPAHYSRRGAGPEFAR